MGSSFIKLPATGATGALTYQGTWNATTNSPALSSGVGTKGYYYVVSVAGTTSLDGHNSWQIGDWAVFNGTAWEEVDNATAVSSVFSRTGAVVAATNDYTWAQIDKTTSSIADITTKNHTDLTAGDGSDHSDVALNTTHRTSDGSDHTFIDQSVVIASSPAFTSAALTTPVLTTSVSGTAFLDDDTFGTATADTLASSESIKAYADALDADDIKLALLGTPTYDSVQDWSNVTQSAGVMDGGAITDAGGGTINVSDVKGIFKTTNSAIGTNVFFDLTGLTGQALTDNSVNYISIDYNSGTPQFVVGVTNTANGHTIYNLGKVFREGTNVDILDSGLRIYDAFKRIQQHHAEESSLHFVSGAIIGETGTRNVSMSAGVMYAGLNRITTDAVDTSGADTFEYYYYDGAAWQESDESQIDNLQYNNIASGLATLANNQYGIHWVYKGTNGDSYIIYGQDSYTLSEAQAVQPPSSLPDHVSEMGVLRGKIIIKKSAAAFTEIQSVADTQFTAATPSNHNELANIDGGTAGEYYHLTNTQHTNLTTYNFDGAVTINEAGADVDFRVESDTDTHALFVQGSDGSVGLGTSSPASGMHLYSATANKQIRIESLNTAGTASIQLRGDTAITQLKTNGSATAGGLLNEPNRTALQATGDGGISLVAQHASGVIALGTGGQTERMRIDNAGNVGIGTDSPDQVLHTYKTSGGNYSHTETAATSDVGVKFTNASGSAYVYKDVDDLILYNTVRAITIDTSGNVGIGRTPTTNDLEVEGTASKTASGDWLANSDRRIKKNIKPIENALDTINRLRPVTFQYTDDYQSKHEVGDKTYWNYIAQEYQEVFPESVQGSGEMLDDQEILQMESGSAQVVAIKAIQELTNLVEKLVKRIDVLESK